MMCKRRSGGRSPLVILLIITNFLCWLSCLADCAVAPVEKITIECSSHQCFIVSEPQIQSQEDLQTYIDAATARLLSANRDLSLQAMVTFRRPLSYQAVQRIIGNRLTLSGSIKYVSTANEEMIFRYPVAPDELTGTGLQPQGQGSHASYVAVCAALPVDALRRLVSSQEVLCVDPGPIELLGKVKRSRIVLTSDLYSKYVQVSGLGAQSTSLDLFSPQRNRPTEFYLSGGRPNPFNPMTQIEYGLTRDCYVRVSICNALGQTLRVLVDEYQLAGRRTAVWDGKDESGRRAASGVYFCRLNAGGYLENKKMLLLK